LVAPLLKHADGADETDPLDAATFKDQICDCRTRDHSVPPLLKCGNRTSMTLAAWRPCVNCASSACPAYTSLKASATSNREADRSSPSRPATSSGSPAEKSTGHGATRKRLHDAY